MKVFGIKCKKCGDFIYSRAVHDFHSCTCEACSIDGGQNEYFRIIGARDDYVGENQHEQRGQAHAEAVDGRRSSGQRRAHSENEHECRIFLEEPFCKSL